MLRHLVLVGLFALTGCGVRADEPPPAEVASALRAVPCFLDEDAFFGWARDGIAPLRRARDAIASGDPGVRPLGREEVRRRLGSADVVLVADLHDRDAFRRALTRLLREHVATNDLACGRVGLGFEAVGPDEQERLRAAIASRDRAALLAVLRRSWPWPVEAYLDVWLDRTLAGVVPFALGDARDRHAGTLDVDDAARRPEAILLPAAPPPPQTGPTGLSLAPPEPRLDFEDDAWMDVKYGLTFHRKNERVASACTAWVREAPGRRMFVLYGAAHLLEDEATGNGIRDLLVRAGLRVEVVVPCVVGWDRALHQRFGAAALHTTYEVLPGVLRVPVDPRELVAAKAALPAPAKDAVLAR